MIDFDLNEEHRLLEQTVGEWAAREVAPHIAELFTQERLERAIGVIYLPESERLSHYFYARLPEQFDAVLHLDETSAVEPLDPHKEVVSEDAPETFPSGV